MLNLLGNSKTLFCYVGFGTSTSVSTSVAVYAASGGGGVPVLSQAP